MNRTLNVPHRPAYNISKPLYTALRDSCEKLESQRQELISARDEIQVLHTKQQNSEFDILLQKLLESCCEGLRTQVGIFEVVVQTVEPEAGVEKSTRQGDLEKVVEILKDTAVEIEERKQNFAKKSTAADPTSSSMDKESATPGNQGSTKVNLGEPAEQTPRKRQKTEHVPGSFKLETVMSPTNPLETTMKGKGKKISKPAASSTSTQYQHPSTTKILPTTTHPESAASALLPDTLTRIPSFEDISAEVSARLAAKAEKKKSKKESKKRKRDSIASSVFSPESKAPLETAKKEEVLPPKKKVKTAGREDESCVVDGNQRRKTRRKPRDKTGREIKRLAKSVANPTIKIPAAANFTTTTSTAPEAITSTSTTVPVTETIADATIATEKQANKGKRRRSSRSSHKPEPTNALPLPGTGTGAQRKKRRIDS